MHTRSLSIYNDVDDDNNNKIIIIIPRQCLWCYHHGRVIARAQLVHLMNAEWHQAAADPRPSSCESACTGCQSLHPPSPFVIITQPES